MDEKNKNSKLSVPASIIAAGALIALAILFSRGSGNVAANPNQPGQDQNASLDEMRKITSDDHIRGDANAPVKIVTYTDFECPFCKQFHTTMDQVMNEYGKDGRVAMIYRQFPLVQLHSQAPKEAEASECVNELGGNDAFWKFADRFFALTPSNDQTDLTKVFPQILSEIGINEAQFNTCLSSGKYTDKVQKDIENAGATGGNGTPWSIVVAKNGKKFPLSGAQPYSAIKQIIETALKED